MNNIGIKFPLGFLLGWANINSITSILILVEHYQELNSNAIESLALVFHIVIFAFSVLMLTYYRDLYYTLFIILVQIGIILTNRDNYSNRNKFTLVFGILTIICFIFSFIFLLKRDDAKETAEMIGNLQNSAEINKNRSENAHMLIKV